MAFGPQLPAYFERLPGESARDHARRLLARGPATDAPSRWGLASRAARELHQRLGRHTHLHQQAVTEALLEAVAEAAADLESAAVAHAALADELAARAAQAELRLIALEVAAGQAPATGWQERVATVASGARGPSAPGTPGAVDLPTDVGDLLYPAVDDVVTPFVRQYGWWEKEEAEELRALLQPGMGFVDIGAHVGYLTLVAAEAVGPSGWGVAVEPAPANFALLSANLWRRGATNVVAIPAAALDTTGRARLRLSADNSGDHRASVGTAGGNVVERGVVERGVVEVASVALDDVIPPDARVDVVKADTQGTDHLALLGMEATVARCRPVMLVEFWPPGIEERGDDPIEVLAYYSAIGYSAEVLGSPGPRESPAAIVEMAAASEGGYCTLILRPA